MMLPKREKLAKKLASAFLALTPGFLGISSLVEAPSAQAQVAQAVVTKIPVNSRTFHLPIRLDEASLSKIREIWLYMKGPNSDWVRKDSVGPATRFFHVQVPSDGEYWFSVVTIDHQGFLTPNNVAQLSPQMILTVDSNSPGSSGEFSTSQTITEPAPLPNGLHASTIQQPHLQQAPHRLTHLPPMPRMNNNSSVAPQEIPLASLPKDTIFTSGSPMSGPNLEGPAKHYPGPNGPGTPFNALTTVSNGRQLVNTTKVGIDYNINKVGPSGVGRIEVWYTRDTGRSWIKGSEDPLQRSPAEVDLPGEGVYGLRLVAVNGNGFGGRAPSPGDSPNIVVEIDLTPPTIQQMEVESPKNGSIDIRWRVSDPNLSLEPIHLFFASQPTGPWQPIAFKLKNDGTFRWTLPRDLPPQLYLRLEAHDQAGNIARQDLTSPILLDLTEPDINVIGVSGLGIRKN